jgi:hypothetical protein
MVTETYQLMQIALGDATVNQVLVFEWFCHFKERKISSKVMSILDTI